MPGGNTSRWSFWLFLPPPPRPPWPWQLSGRWRQCLAMGGSSTDSTTCSLPGRHRNQAGRSEEVLKPWNLKPHLTLLYLHLHSECGSMWWSIQTESDTPQGGQTCRQSQPLGIGRCRRGDPSREVSRLMNAILNFTVLFNICHRVYLLRIGAVLVSPKIWSAVNVLFVFTIHGFILANHFQHRQQVTKVHWDSFIYEIPANLSVLDGSLNFSFI